MLARINVASWDHVPLSFCECSTCFRVSELVCDRLMTSSRRLRSPVWWEKVNAVVSLVADDRNRYVTVGPTKSHTRTQMTHAKARMRTIV